MADNSIDIIYDEIRAVLLDLSLEEAKEYFSHDQVPDTLLDNSFVISPMALSPGDLATPDNKFKVWNLAAGIKVNLSFKLSANNIIQVNKKALLKVEAVIKGILSIVCGEDEKDSIVYTGAEPIVDNNDIVYEVNFILNYRIKNI